VYHYLYFRIPILHPYEFLDKSLPRVWVLVSKQAKFIYLLFACIGLYFLSQRFQNYVSTFLYFFSLKGFIAYIIVIVTLKTAHEFGHAFVAKHYGVRVPTMGLAFMVFAPMAYSDVTDSWRLRSRKKRLKIALAGVKVELVIGAFAMALWGLTPPGILNSICFLLSSTTLLSTFLVNLNPAMRFDGYYILSDLWGIDNLSSQTTQYTKWFLRRNLLGLDAPCPILKPKPLKQLKIILYSIYAWNYRFFLYLGIAILVYYKFTKTLGLILFFLEIMIFIVRPIIEEIKILMKMKSQIKFNFKLSLTLFVVLLASGWAILPLPRTKEAPAIFLPVHSQIAYASREGQIKDTLVERGQTVKKGAVLAYLESEPLNTEIEYLLISRKQLRHDIERLTMDEEHRAMVPEMEKQLASLDEKLAGLIEQRNQLIIKAKISGKVVEWDPMLIPGCYIKKHQALGRIAATDDVRIDAFVSEKEVKHLDIGQEIKFYPSDRSDYVPGVVENVDPIREESVNFLDIGTAAANELPLVDDPSSGKLNLLESYYRVSIAVNKKYHKNVRLGQSGNVRYLSHKRSLAWELLLYAYSVIIRESSF
ncbi:MAG: efflux RND transporter periplasmic adaptor subunit, partial [Deltaproteobacteria bacterium]|jgi:putative peptide zinc metalloprotease protein|nr:efflux RND transporter periplasmic adaptor subunit [Deltaproteobacteria bacterium]